MTRPRLNSRVIQMPDAAFCARFALIPRTPCWGGLPSFLWYPLGGGWQGVNTLLPSDETRRETTPNRSLAPGLQTIVPFVASLSTCRRRLTVATEIIKHASPVIISRSLSALMIRLTREMGKSVVPGCLSARDWRCLIGRLMGFFGWSGSESGWDASVRGWTVDHWCVSRDMIRIASRSESDYTRKPMRI